MASARCLALLVLIAGASAGGVTPIDKVIKLIGGLQKEVEDEGKAEADAYNTFACFCKDTTTKKSDSVKRGNDNINDLSSDIADKTQAKKEDATELMERKGKQEQLSKDLDETIARCSKEKAAYEAEEADLSKAVSSLNGAIKSMKTSRLKGAASLLAVKSVVQRLFDTNVIAKASASMQKRVASLVHQKVDPEDPGYAFHSNDIIDLCEDLLTDFKNEKKELDTEWSKTEKGCTETKKSLRQEMTTNSEAMANLDKDISRLGREIAQHREDLVQAEADMKDDQLYLKDLTARCEDRANDYDQRSAMRNDEATALSQAMDILTNNVKSAADTANKRAFLQVPEVVVAPKVQHATAAKPVSFLQGVLVQKHSLLRGRAVSSLELEAKKNRALDMLQGEGRRIGSVTIASLTVRAGADPFQKVKGLIQKLIERLLEESKNEATKKGFCDTAIGKAEHDRDARFVESNDLSREVKALEAKEDELSQEIEVLTKDIKDEKEDLKNVSEDRDKEKAANIKTLDTAKEGYEAVTDALQVLKSFYSQAAKASSLLQASPLDEDTAGAGFSGAYKGKQGGMKAVFALLETIQSDFDRTLRKTDEAEAKAHRDYVEFSQTSKSSIAGKTTKKELDEEDLRSTRTGIKQKMQDLQANVDLLDSALKELEELKPSCIDTGMSYKERVEKREEEMKALKKALCMLDTDRVESECQ